MDAQNKPTPKNDEMREFMLVVRQALKMVVAWIERRYVEDKIKA